MAKKDDDDFRTRLAKLEFRSAVLRLLERDHCIFWCVRFVGFF